MDEKRQEDSLSVAAQQVLPQQANAAGNIHGGEIMKMMDSVAGIAAMRHSHTNAVTARVDELIFKKPIKIGDYVTCTGRVVYTGRTSMEVFVTVESENLATGAKHVALTAFFTMVALDKYGISTAVPPVLPGDDPFSQKLYESGRNRYKENRERRNRKINKHEDARFYDIL